VLKWPQNGEKQHKKTIFWLFWTISPKKNDLVKGLILSLVYLFGSVCGCPNGAKMAKKSIKKLLIWTIPSKRMGLIIWLGAYF
jgi:hypothetical protein